MNNTLSRFILLLPAFGVMPCLYGQSHPNTPDYQEVTVINPHDRGSGDTTIVNVYNIFLENAPKSFRVPGAPRFAIEGKDRKFYLGIGGTGKVTLSYDWGNPIDNAYDFTTSAIPMGRRDGDGGLIQASAATSGLYFNFVAMPGSKNRIGLYFNFNLTGNGNGYGFNLYYAYIPIWPRHLRVSTTKARADSRLFQTQ